MLKFLPVSGIPSLLLVDEHGEVISTNGRAVLAKDPDGKVGGMLQTILTLTK